MAKFVQVTLMGNMLLQKLGRILPELLVLSDPVQLDHTTDTLLDGQKIETH